MVSRMRRRAFVRGLSILGAASATGCCFGEGARGASELPPPPPSPAPSMAEPAPARTAATPMPDWDPTRSVVLAVGVLRWARADLYDAMETTERRDRALVDTWIARGVPRERVTYLADAEATLAGARAALAASLATVRPDDTFLFYWAGHGDRTDSGAGYAVPYDAGDDSTTSCLAYDEIVRAVEAVPMARAMFFADTCYSGAIADAVLARPGGPPRAGLGASMASESSTGNWTFTDAVIAAFGGAANVDHDRDGVVTVSDLARFVEEEMAFADGQLAHVEETEAFPLMLRLSPAEAAPCPRYGERIEVLQEGTWWPATITGEHDGQLDVHYDGYTEQWDATVAASETRPYAPVAYAPGTRASVEWNGEWYPAEIREARRGVHLVHYDGFDDVWDEWVSRDRIRVG
jgi:hypothetical protein